jgi:uncharacterized protein YceH (UPF0502 family)
MEAAMGEGPTTEGTSRNGPWPVLDVLERRVLGVLVEKAKTTPDAYPLSVNALVSGSNQKSNRDPLLNVSDFEVEDALTRCKDKGLAVKIIGGRVVRWRHYLYESWLVDKHDLAVLAELLLRGPQTEGELRSRAARMEPFDDLEALRRTLRPLVERNLVVYLTPEDRRGAMLTHGFHGPQELARLRARASAAAVSADNLPATSISVASELASHSRSEVAQSALAARGVETNGEIAALKRSVDELRSEVDALKEELRSLKASLGA